jgi:hypothetical protein
MLVTFTNATASEKLHIPSLGPKNIVPGGSITASRGWSDLEADSSLRELVETGKVTLSFTKETGDDAGLFFGRVPVAYADATRPAAANVPIFSAIWNTDDDALNWSDGTNWLDATGAIT